MSRKNGNLNGQTSHRKRDGGAARASRLPHDQAVEKLLASPDFVDAMFRTIDRDPLTALHIATERGLILYANDQAARMFLGKGVRGADAMGLSWNDLFPAPLVEERLHVLRAILEDGEARYVRSIYFGLQVITRYENVGPLEGVAGGDRVFLCVTRHEPRALEGGTLDGVRIVEPRTNYMGPLAKLTPREIEVLVLIAEGQSITEMAETLGRSIHTVNDQRRTLGRKLGAQDRVRLAEVARDAGLNRRDFTLASLDHLAVPMPTTGGPPVPPERLMRIGFATPGFVRGLWRTLNDDPFAAFQVVIADSRLVHANMNVVRMFVPELGDVSALLGKRYDEVAPMDLVRDRMAIIASVAQFHKPRIQRSIYQGLQTLTRLEYCAPVAGVSDAKGLVLLASRRTPADVIARLPAHARRLIVTPKMQRLGAIAKLSPREREVLALIGEGLSNRQIALRLHRTEDTVEDHRQSLGKKLGVDDRVRLADIARQAGLTMAEAQTQSLDSLERRG